MAHFNFGKRYVARRPISERLLIATPEQIAWFAGYFEGEGSVVTSLKTGERRVYASVRLQANSTDEDALERVQEIMGGRIHYAPQAPPRKPQWSWHLHSYENVTYAFEKMQPWLSRRRKDQFVEAIRKCDAVREPLLLSQ